MEAPWVLPGGMDGQLAPCGHSDAQRRLSQPFGAKHCRSSRKCTRPLSPGTGEVRLKDQEPQGMKRVSEERR